MSRTPWPGPVRQQPGPVSCACSCPAVALLAVAAASAASRAEPKTKPKARFAHVVMVVFENHEADQVLGKADAPMFNRLATRYATLTNYTAVTHPSLPNYLALVSGSTQGIESDCTGCVVNGRSLADTLEASNKTWKAYAEGLPYAGFTGANSGRYAKKHNPFVYFRRNLSGRRLRRIVPFTQFLPDLRRKRLPAFSLVIPDLCHDMHDCGAASGDAWLGAFMRPLLRGPALRDTWSSLSSTRGRATSAEVGGCSPSWSVGTSAATPG
jgi:hypothetical protein